LNPKDKIASPAMNSQKDQEIKGPSVWVKKWVDYSSKYGLGYLLSNYATGVFFNDSTKVVMDPIGKVFYYYERKTISSTEKQDVMITHSLTDYPKDLQKKVTLLQHFRSYLENNQANKEDVEMREESPQQQTPLSPKSTTTATIYVKKWMRTKHAIMFRLSNKIVQVSFQDHTEILLNSESRLVTYVNKKNER
jgi:polo-like kinase 1